jgi:hypothetical protein
MKLSTFNSILALGVLLTPNLTLARPMDPERARHYAELEKRQGPLALVDVVPGILLTLIEIADGSTTQTLVGDMIQALATALNPGGAKAPWVCSYIQSRFLSLRKSLTTRSRKTQTTAKSHSTPKVEKTATLRPTPHPHQATALQTRTPTITTGMCVRGSTPPTQRRLFNTSLVPSPSLPFSTPPQILTIPSQTPASATTASATPRPTQSPGLTPPWVPPGSHRCASPKASATHNSPSTAAGIISSSTAGS